MDHTNINKSKQSTSSNNDENTLFNNYESVFVQNNSKYWIKYLPEMNEYLKCNFNMENLQYHDIIFFCINLLSVSVHTIDSRLIIKIFRQPKILRKKFNSKSLTSICKKIIEVLSDKNPWADPSLYKSHYEDFFNKDDEYSNLKFSSLLKTDQNNFSNLPYFVKFHCEYLNSLCKLLQNFDSGIHTDDSSSKMDVIQDEETEKNIDVAFSEVKVDNSNKTNPEVYNGNSLLNCISEVVIFLNILLVIAIIDTREPSFIEKNLHAADLLMNAVKIFNKRSMDLLTAKAYFFCSLAYERAGRFSEIREELMLACRSATLHHDSNSHAMLLNLLLRNFLYYNLYHQATKLVNKINFPDSYRSNAQLCRYLYYLGRIQAEELEYSDAHNKLMQALRKAPQGEKLAKGFRIATLKLAIVVELLMGDITEKMYFYKKELRGPLIPYRNILQAVRSGDLHLFKKVVESKREKLMKDKTYFLICRLHHNVLRTGLRKINLAYSKIYLSDISKKLGLEKDCDIEGIISKTISDGVIDARIDYTQKYFESNPSIDIYRTNEPAKAFQKRIDFCLQIHSQAIKAMNYPEDIKKNKSDSDARRQRQQEELARVEDDDMNDEMDIL